MILVAVLALAAAEAPPTAAQPAKAVSADDKIICRTQEVTGSLARRIRTCHTVAEWRAISDAAQATGQRMLDNATINSKAGGG